MSTDNHIYEVGARSSAISLITLDEAKNYLKVDTTEDDALIEILIESAIDMAEEYCWTVFDKRSISLFLPTVEAGDVIKLRRGPASILDEITVVYYDADNVLNVALSTYFFVSIGGDSIIVKDSLPTSDVVDRSDAWGIFYESQVGVVPKAVKNACLLMLGDFYENRVDTGYNKFAMPKTAERLLNMYRRCRY